MTEHRAMSHTPPPERCAATGLKPAPGTPVIIDVYARTGGGGSVDFSHEWGWESGGIEGSDAIDIPARDAGQPGTPIHFHLHDLTRPRRRLEFAEDRHDGPIWVSRVGCPPANQKCTDQEIPEGKMKWAPKVLKVVDENKDECTLHYRLRFIDREGRPEAYDPEIKNGGTNRL